MSYRAIHDLLEGLAAKRAGEPGMNREQSTNKDSRSVQAKKSKGFTLIELLVVIAIISLLVSILLPSLNKAKDLARGVVCASNLRNLATAAGMYAHDHDGMLLRDCDGPPQEYIWTYTIRPYLGGPNLPELRKTGDADEVPPAEGLICPSADYAVEEVWETCYAENMLIGWSWERIAGWEDKFLTQADLGRPFQTLYFMDYRAKLNAGSPRVVGTRCVHPAEWLDFNPDPLDSLRHNERGNVAWADGSVGTVDEASLNLDEVSEWWDLAGLSHPWDPFED